jgi:hypothetical protein
MSAKALIQMTVLIAADSDHWDEAEPSKSKKIDPLVLYNSE